MSDTSTPLRFGPFEFFRETGELRKDGAPVALAPKPTRILGTLLDRPGTLVTREALYQSGWGDARAGVDLALNAAIRAARRALGDRADQPAFIQTVPRRGYRFIAPVEQAPRRAAGTLQRTSTRPFRGRALAGRQTAFLLAGAAVLAVAATRALRPTPTVEVHSVRVLDSGFEAGTGPLLEERIRQALHQSAGEDVAVLASSAEPGSGRTRAEYVIHGILYEAAPGEPRFAARLVRGSDGVILWAGEFNPFCPRVSDPVGFISDYVSRVLVRRVT